LRSGRRFVTRCRNHAALVALAAYDDGQATQFRPRQQLNGNKKRVHINVQNRSGRIRGNLQRGVVLGAKLGQLRHAFLCSNYTMGNRERDEASNCVAV